MSKRPLTVPLAAASAVLMLSALAGCSSDDSGDSAKDPAPTTAAADGPACTYTADGSKPAKEVDLPPDHAAVSGTVDVCSRRTWATSTPPSTPTPRRAP